MASRLESVASNVSFVLEQNAQLITVGTISALAAVPILQNYRAYIDAGRGGLPPNLYGWAKSTFLKIFVACETTNTDMYLGDPNKDTWLDPSEITRRPGDRPTFNWHPVPSRQINQRADAAMHQVRPVHISPPHDPKLTVPCRKSRSSCLSTRRQTRTSSKSRFLPARRPITRWSSTTTFQHPTESPLMFGGRSFTFTRVRIGQYTVSSLR